MMYIPFIIVMFLFATKEGGVLHFIPDNWNKVLAHLPEFMHKPLGRCAMCTIFWASCIGLFAFGCDWFTILKYASFYAVSSTLIYRLYG